jgi:3,4-dihydroxy 2-butanone 4-phosphate synthase/GTP cyclohydrolase II
MPKISVLAPRLKAAIEALQKGEMVILIDSEDRENEGDLVLAAEFATADKVNFLIRKACGLVCLALEADQVDRLGLPPMVQDNQTERKTAFTVSIEAAEGISTGISAQDRAHTIKVAANPNSTRTDIIAPGHVFPLRAAPGGVLERAGHTEGSIELCKIAGLQPAAVICEIMNEDGTMARNSDLEKFSKTYNIPIITIEELIVFQIENKTFMEGSASARFPSRYALDGNHPFLIRSFKNPFSGVEHSVIYTEKFGSKPLVRVHSECLTGDALGSLRCDCGEQLRTSIDLISKNPEGGAVIYLKNHEGRGIGFWNKIEAYAIQDQGKDTLDANLALGFHGDERHYHEAAAILKMMQLNQIRLLTNNPEKVKQLETFGISVIERVAIEVASNPENAQYLQTKRNKFKHWIGTDV